MQIERDLQFSENHIVIHTFFWLGLWTLLPAAPLIDQSIEEGREHRITTFFVVWIIVFFQPGDDLGSGDPLLSLCEQRNDLVVAQIEYVANSAQAIICFHFFFNVYCY